MAKTLVDDDLWALVELLLLQRNPLVKETRPRTRNRLCLAGIIFVLKTGIRWQDFPQEMGCCGMTLWNRLAEWRQSGAWNSIHQVLLTNLKNADLIDWSRAIRDNNTGMTAGSTEDPASRRGRKTNMERIEKLRRMRRRNSPLAGYAEFV